MKIRDLFIARVYISLPDGADGFSYRSKYGWLSSRRWLVPTTRFFETQAKGQVPTVPLPDARTPKYPG